MGQGYIVLNAKRGHGVDNHAERRLIRWMDGEFEGEAKDSSGENIQADDRHIEVIAVSRVRGICAECWRYMQEKGIRRGSLLQPTRSSPTGP